MNKDDFQIIQRASSRGHSHPHVRMYRNPRNDQCFLGVSDAVMTMGGLSVGYRVEFAANQDNSIVAIALTEGGSLLLSRHGGGQGISANRLRGILQPKTNYPITRDEKTGWLLIDVAEGVADA